MVGFDRRRLKLLLSLYRYGRKISNAYQRKVFVANKLIKEVINLVKLLATFHWK